MTPKEKAINIIERSKGDDLERAEGFFRNHTPEEMQGQHGASGKTCQQILDEYRQERKEYHEALQWVKRQWD